jgi:spore coat protein CotH
MNNANMNRRHRRLGLHSVLFELGKASAFCLLGFVCTVRVFGADVHSSGLPNKPSDLFQTDKVWIIHLQFSPEQWRDIEPVQSEVTFPGPGQMRFAGPDGPPGLDITSVLVPSFLRGDQHKDRKLSKEEFSALAESWFGEWDKDKRGELDFNQLRAGVNSTLGLSSLVRPAQRGGAPGPPLQSEAGHRNGLAGASGIDFKYIHANLEFEGGILKDVAVRYKGNATYMESRNSFKRSFKIDLNKYVKGQKLAGLSKLNLHNNVTDASWMNEVLSYRLFRDAAVPASRTAYARVYVTVPGLYDKKYFGLYSVVEDVDRHFAEDRFGSKEGMIYKPVTRDLFGYLGDDWSKYNHIYDPKAEPSQAQKQRVIDLSQLVTSASDAEFSARIAEYLDLEEFARFMSVTVWLSTLDSILMMGQNFYVYLHPKTHKFEFIPWDLDHSFGQFPMGGTQEQREQLSIEKPWRGANRFLERVFSVDAFKKLYRATMADFSKTIFLPERFSKQVDEIAAAIRPAVREESESKLARFDKVVEGESIDRFGFGGGPDHLAGPGGDGPRFRGGGFGQQVKPIKAFVKARAQSVAAQLAGTSEGAEEVQSPFPGFRARGGVPGGPGEFGPSAVLAKTLMEKLDANQDGKLTHDEFVAGFAKWFAEWNTDKTGLLSQDQLRSGIHRDLRPFHAGPPGGFGFGPPHGPPDE